MKKVWRLIISLILLFSLFLYFYFRSTDYKISYKLEKFQINEEYNKKKREYIIDIIYNKQKFSYNLNNKYNHKRKLISKISFWEENDAKCIKPQSKYLSIYDVCLLNNELVTPNVVKDTEKVEKIVKKYENVTIYDYSEKNFLLWNYRNYIYLNNKNKNEFVLFKKDLYSLKLVYATSRYLFVPNQENDYTFTDYYLIDSQKNKIKKIKLNKEIYFDSYILGDKNNKIYLVDRKNNQEYEINLSNGKIKKLYGKILKNGKWQDISLTKLVNGNYTFTTDKYIAYKIENDYLYAYINNIKIKLSAQKVSVIVKDEGNGVYYIAGDTLYYFNFATGEKKLMTYSEWNFNYNNMVYIFD